MTEPAIRAEALTRDYGRSRALDGLDMRIEPGRVVALLGPNGAGKSTLLRLVGGLLAPTAGSVRVLGLDPRADEVRLAGRIAALHEGHEPPWWATAQRLLALQAEASPEFDRAFADGFCFSRGVKPRTPYAALSKGQRRWVLAGLVLASGAPVMLFDEPADGLDPAARRALYDAMRERATALDATIVVATHIIHDVERVADDVAILRRGRLLLHASLEDLREEVREIELPAEAGGGTALVVRASRLQPPPLAAQEFAGGTPAPQGGPSAGIEILARRAANGVELAWVRMANGMVEADLRAALPAGAIVRPVGLEDLYLALAEQAECPSHERTA